MRKLITEADPDVVEEWKWMNPVWAHDGIICTGESYKKAVKLIRPVSSTRASTETRSEEHTSELQSQSNLVCRLLLEKRKLYVRGIDSRLHHSRAHQCRSRRP